MAVDVANGTVPLDLSPPVLYLLVAWRDLMVVIASSKVRVRRLSFFNVLICVSVYVLLYTVSARRCKDVSRTAFHSTTFFTASRQANMDQLFGDRAFSEAGPHVWNCMPTVMQSCRLEDRLHGHCVLLVLVPVIQPFQTVAEDIFIWSLGPKCSVIPPLNSA